MAGPRTSAGTRRRPRATSPSPTTTTPPPTPHSRQTRATEPPYPRVTPYASYVPPAPPAVALQFVRAKALQGATRAATIANAIDWARRLKHYVSTPSGVPTAVFQRVWGYRGPAPVSATIATTIDTDVDASNPYHFTAGWPRPAGLLQLDLPPPHIPADQHT